MKINDIELPDGVTKDDIKYPSYKSKVKRLYQQDFELWYASQLGWCIPTLLIARGGSSGISNRTYATTMKGQGCRIGMGPHITAKVQVYVTAKNVERLKPLLDLKAKGEVEANTCRDRRSTLAMRRSMARSW